MTQQLIQKHRNAIGQLERSRDMLTADLKTMRQDLIGQRAAMEEALGHLSGKCDRAAAMATLRAVLEYRNAQRTPRKATT